MGEPIRWTAKSDPWGKRRPDITGSTLTFADGELTWEPLGVPRREPGRTPFTVTVGPGVDQAQELVWLYDSLGLLRVDVLVVCSADPDAPGGRRVLGYLPTELVAGPPPMLRYEARNEEASARRIRAMARVLGLDYAQAGGVEFGRRFAERFPGAIPYAWGVAVGYYAMALTSLAAGVYLVVGLLTWPNGWDGPGFLIALWAAAVLQVVMGVLTLPPLMNAQRAWGVRRRARRHPDESAGDGSDPGEVAAGGS